MNDISRKVKSLLQQVVFVALVFCLGAGQALAVEVENLYRGKILVTDKSQQTRIKAHRWAIEQVLTKVTGSREILANKDVQYEIRVRTANYIKSFSFVTDEQNRIFLVDEFDQSKIDSLIRKVNGSIWGQRRPLTAIWLVVEEGQQRNFVTTADFPQLTEVAIQSAENRGLPVVIPAMTQEQRSQVYTSDVWARFDQIIYPQSKQIDAEHFVMARLRYVDAITEPEYKTGWLLDYQLFDGRQFLTEGSFNGEQFDVTKEMINELGDYFAKVYAINNNRIQQQEVTLIVNNLTSMLNLKAAEKHILDLPPVKKAYLQSVEGSTAKFKLWLSGQALDVVKALGLLNNFEQVEDTSVEQKQKLTVEEKLDQLSKDYIGLEQVNAVATPQQQQVLTYRWRVQ